MKHWDKKDMAMKGLAVLFAVFLWFYVGIEKDPVVERYYQLPIETKNLSDGLTASLSSNQVGITLRDRGTRLSSVSVDSFAATVDLSSVQIGDNRVRVELKAPGMVRVSKITPQEISVNVTQNNGIAVPVQIDRTGTPPQGVQLGQMTLSADTVFVSGSPAMLAQIDHGVVTVDQSKINGTYSEDLPVRLYSQMGQEIADGALTIHPQKIRIVVAVNETLSEKRVPIHAKSTGVPASGYILERIDVVPAEVTLIGAENDLANVEYVETAPIGISDLSVSKRFSTELVLPPQLSTTNGVDVVADVRIAQATGKEKLHTVDIPIHLTGNPQTGKASIIGVGVVKVTYTGDADEATAKAAMRAVVDVSTLAPGTYDLSVSVTSSSDTVAIEKIEPTTVRVGVV